MKHLQQYCRARKGKGVIRHHIDMISMLDNEGKSTDMQCDPWSDLRKPRSYVMESVIVGISSHILHVY
jgi:hypothetical protein